MESAEWRAASPQFVLTSIDTLSGSMLLDIAGPSALCCARKSSESEASHRRSARRVFVDGNITIKQ